jgi:hypothetical protein
MVSTKRIERQNNFRPDGSGPNRGRMSRIFYSAISFKGILYKDDGQRNDEHGDTSCLRSHRLAVRSHDVGANARRM